MSAKTLKIKISLGSENGTKHKLRRSVPTQESHHTSSPPNYSKSGQPIKLAALLTISVVGIMSWLFFFSPVSAPPTTTPLFSLSTPASTTNKDLTPTRDITIQTTKITRSIPAVAILADKKEVPSTSEAAKPLAQPTSRVHVATEPITKPAITKQADSTFKSNNNIARAQFTNGISKREPIDDIAGQLTAAEQELKKLYYFTELQGLKGQTITHQWQYDNKVVAKVEFKVRGNRWRVYSSKYLKHYKKGTWQVIVKDEKGKLLETSQFTYK